MDRVWALQGDVLATNEVAQAGVVEVTSMRRTKLLGISVFAELSLSGQEVMMLLFPKAIQARPGSAMQAQ